jgi:hypothetical protein
VTSTPVRWVAAGLALGAALSLAACQSDPNSLAAQAGSGSRAGYAAGDGSIEQLPPASRGQALALSGTTVDGGTWSIAARMIAAVADARDAARGHEALLVSHQLPVWTARSRLEGRRLWHDPRKRQCALASLTSLHYLGNELVSVVYSEPAATLVRDAAKKAGA